MSEIKTRIFNYGHEKESEWPPRFGTGESGLFHVDESGEVHEGYPPSRLQIFDQAPYIVGDSISAYKHPATGQWVESRSALKAIDEATGCITTDKYIAPDPTRFNEAKRKIKEERREELRAAYELVKSGNSPLTDQQKAECRARDKQIDQTLGIDVFSKIGKKE
jgi:hypothetical protein